MPKLHFVEYSDYTNHSASDFTDTHTHTTTHTVTHPVSIIFVHGYVSHVGAYDHFLKDVNKETKITIYAINLEGHGDSNGRVASQDIDFHVKSVETLVKQLDLNPKETIVMGHSMGGLIAASTVMDNSKYKGGVFLSPFFDQPTYRPIPEFVLYGLFEGFPFDMITIDIETVVDPKKLSITKKQATADSFRSDPLVPKNVPIATLSKFLLASKKIVNRKLYVPSYIVMSKNDELVDIDGAKKFSDNNHMVTLVESAILDEGGHELHNEKISIYDAYIHHVCNSINKILDYTPNDFVVVG